MNELRYKIVCMRSVIMSVLLLTGSVACASSTNHPVEEKVTTQTFIQLPVPKAIITKLFTPDDSGEGEVIEKIVTFKGVPHRHASNEQHEVTKDKSIAPHHGIAKEHHAKKVKVAEKKESVSHLVKIKHPKKIAAVTEDKSSQKSNAHTKGVKKKSKPAVSRSNHKVSLNFQNIKTRVLLQLLAKTSNLNFIISENVNGSMTLHLKNVPWRQALNIILKANGLDSRRYGDVILIAPIKELADNEINALTARQQVEQLAPLHSEILRFNYANATDMANLLKSQTGAILTHRGQVGVDSRTNSLWIRDLPSKIDEVKHFVEKLDIPAKQVLIEARIVSIDKTFTRDLGVRFGVSRTGRLSHKLLKADGTTSYADETAAIADRLIFDIPSGLKNPASLALSLIRLGSKSFLDLELSALEKEGHAETISTPRLITSNQKEAVIEKGEEIPYLTASSSGSTSVEFKKAVLSLKIVPQITPDRNIVLQLKVTQDTKGEQIQSNNGEILPPSINTKEVESHVFLHNGQTIVIGGIYERISKDDVQRVPFFGKLPLIGALFKQRVRTHDQHELLIFITPRIIDSGYRGPKYVMGVHKCCDTPRPGHFIP